MSLHPDQETLGELLAGKLEPRRADALLSHISECEACSELAEAAWGGVEDLSKTLEVPRLSRRRSSRIELELVQKVRLAELGTQISWIVTDGFLAVVLVLLRPVVGRPLSDSGGGKST